MSKRIDLTGKKFGNWYVEKFDRKEKNNMFWFCRCLLCNKLYSIQAGNLTSGKTKKCKKCSGSAFIDLEGKQFGD